MSGQDGSSCLLCPPRGSSTKFVSQMPLLRLRTIVFSEYGASAQHLLVTCCLSAIIHACHAVVKVKAARLWHFKSLSPSFKFLLSTRPLLSFGASRAQHQVSGTMIILISFVYISCFATAAFPRHSKHDYPSHSASALQPRSEGLGPSQSSGSDPQQPPYHRTLSQLGIDLSPGGSTSPPTSEQPPRSDSIPVPSPPSGKPHRGSLREVLRTNNAILHNINDGGSSPRHSLRTTSHRDLQAADIIAHAPYNPAQAKQSWRGLEMQVRRAGGEVASDSATMKRLASQSRSLSQMRLAPEERTSSKTRADEIAEEARREVEERVQGQGEGARPPSGVGASNVSIKGSKSVLELALKDQKRYEKKVRKRLKQKQKKAAEAEKAKQLKEGGEGASG